MNNIDKLLDASEVARLQTLLPAGLRDKSENLVKFLEDYYSYMNTEGPSATVNSLLPSHDLYEMSDEYLAAVQDEIAPYIPAAAKMDRRTTFKRIVKYFYNMRGSRESAQVFFKLFYNTECTISDPVPVDLISSLELNQQHWLPFSYYIGVNLKLSEWEKPYRALIHPAGFRFYTADEGAVDENGNVPSSLSLLFTALNKWDLLKADVFTIDNTDLTTAEDIPYLYSYGKFQEFTTDSYYFGPADRKVYNSPAAQPGWIVIPAAAVFVVQTELGYLGRTHYDYDNMLKFYEPNVPIGDFGSYTIEAAGAIEVDNQYTTAQLSNLGAYVNTTNGSSDVAQTINTLAVVRPYSMVSLNFTSNYP